VGKREGEERRCMVLEAVIHPPWPWQVSPHSLYRSFSLFIQAWHYFLVTFSTINSYMTKTFSSSLFPLFLLLSLPHLLKSSFPLHSLHCAGRPNLSHTHRHPESFQNTDALNPFLTHRHPESFQNTDALNPFKTKTA